MRMTEGTFGVTQVYFDSGCFMFYINVMWRCPGGKNNDLAYFLCEGN